MYKPGLSLMSLYYDHQSYSNLWSYIGLIVQLLTYFMSKSVCLSIFMKLDLDCLLFFVKISHSIISQKQVLIIHLIVYVHLLVQAVIYYLNDLSAHGSNPSQSLIC